MRLALLPGLLLLVWALPELTRRLGGRVPVALWVAVANPMMVIHMIGGGHNDLLVVGLLAAGSLVALRGAARPAASRWSPWRWRSRPARRRAAVPGAGLGRAHCPARAGPHRQGHRGGHRACSPSCSPRARSPRGSGLGWLPALSAPSMIVNWMSLPTGVGEFMHTAGQLARRRAQAAVHQRRPRHRRRSCCLDRRAGSGGRRATAARTRSAGPASCCSRSPCSPPPRCPWYVSWGMALLAADRVDACAGCSARSFVSLMLVIVYYPNGEDALYNLPYLLACGLLAAARRGLAGAPGPAAARRAPAQQARPADPGDPRRHGAGGLRPSSPVPSAGRAELDAAGITDPALRAAYTACRALNARARPHLLPRHPAAARRPAGPRCTRSTASPGTPTRSSTTSTTTGRPPRRPPGSTRWTRAAGRRRWPATPTAPPGAGRAGRHRPPVRASTAATSPTSWPRCGWTPTVTDYADVRRARPATCTARPR